jgi:cell wall-associated NlpC family hydrolase
VAYYRYRPRYRTARRLSTGQKAAAAAGAAVALAGAGHGAASAVSHPKPAARPGHAAAVAIAYAKAQLGKPYQWGGTGPGAFDCSGLVMDAWQAAGISIARTSQEQWATLPHIPASRVRPGDLVFFPGSDGTAAAPGHVAIVLSATEMLQAYAPGTPIEISPLNGDGAGGIVGYARP